jgi:hypothetical protein
MPIESDVPNRENRSAMRTMIPRYDAALAFAFLLLVFSCVSRAAVIPCLGIDNDPGADIRGVVSDSANGERILGANVQIRGTKRGSSTNNEGFYLISSVPEGTYEIVVSAVGYTRRSVKVAVSGTEPITVNVKLASRAIETGEIVVESEGLPSFTERSVSVHIVTPKELQTLPAAAQPDLLRSLQMLPGITSTSDVSAKFFVRGGAADQNLILLDGMKVYNPFHALGLFSIFDPDITRNAEVYTGAFPAGYGGRLSSVVNVTTKDGNRNKLSGMASINFLTGKLELDGPLGDDNSFLISGRSSMFGNVIDRMIPNAPPTSFFDLFVKGTVGTSTGRFGFRGYTSGDDVKPTELDQPNYTWRNSACSAVFSSLVTDRLYFDGSASYSRSSIKRTRQQLVVDPPASSLLEEFSLRGEMTTFMENQDSFFEGFEFNFPSVTDSLYARNAYPRLYRDAGSEWYAWVRYEGNAGPFRLNLGIHSDLALLFAEGSLSKSLQPRLTVSYGIDETWVAKASYGVFTQNLITISNEDDLISLFDAWLWLPDNLRPEEARHYVFSIEGNIVPSLATSVQIYSKDYRSVTLYNPAKIFPEDPDYISGTGLAYGAEALLRYTSPLIDLYGSYAWARVTVSGNGFSYSPRYDRRHSIKAVGTLHLFQSVDATLRWEYGSGYPFTQGNGFYTSLSLSGVETDPFPEGPGNPVLALGEKNASRLPAYHRMDFGLMYHLTVGTLRGTLGVNFINVYDAKNILYYDRMTGKTGYMIPFFPTASLSVEF